MGKGGVKRSRDAEEEPAEGTVDISNVMYLGCIPHGFYEDQLRDYFSQFGLVTKVRVSRNKKTGNSKHYAFVQFASPEVAAIAAEAMDGHMMFTCKLRARVLKAADVHPDLFKGSHRKFAKVPWQRIQADSHNRQRTAEEEDMRLRRLVEKDKKRAKRIKALGIDYDYEPLEAQLPPRAQHLTFAEEV